MNVLLYSSHLSMDGWCTNADFKALIEPTDCVIMGIIAAVEVWISGVDAEVVKVGTLFVAVGVNSSLKPPAPTTNVTDSRESRSSSLAAEESSRLNLVDSA